MNSLYKIAEPRRVGMTEGGCLLFAPVGMTLGHLERSGAGLVGVSRRGPDKSGFHYAQDFVGKYFQIFLAKRGLLW